MLALTLQSVRGLTLFNTIYITFQGNRLNHAELTMIEVRLHKDVKGADCVDRSSSRVEWSEMER